VDRLRRDLQEADAIAIVGGGYIGLEAAATLVKLGRRVTILEAQPRLLTRVSGPPISQFLAAKHASHGVELKLQAVIAGMQGRNNRVRSVALADGSELQADLVIVGIGMEPNTGPLAAAGAAISNGVRVDAQCRTSLPDVLAIGDCTLQPNRFSATGWARLESVPNAMDQAAVAARVLMGESAAHDSVPWFWSDQYDTKLQTVGLAPGYDVVAVRGDPACGSFSVVYLRGGRIAALDCVNSPRDFIQGRQLVAQGVSADAQAIASTPQLKALVG
jgi:3-phenylpropionate/trans-cinnamate dioxygenase ferredoxin reductase subunit